MNRLYIKSRDTAQKTVEGLYKDLERRIAASPPGQCPVDLASSFLKLCHSQSCGKCTPCRVGLGQLQMMIDDILEMNTEPGLETLELLEKTAEAISVSADCAIGFEAANMVLRGLKGYRDDFESHIKYHACADNIKNQAQPVPCVAMCPAGVDVPGYISLLKHERYADAVRLIRKDNPFPTVCALICEHPCEQRCRRTLVDAPVNIRGLKRFAVDNCGDVPVPQKMDDTGKKIAVIGGGPSGLSAAYFLSIMGHHVTVFEKRAQLGGMLRYGIPNYRLPRERLQWDIDAILSTGVEAKCDFDISSPEGMDEIRNHYDATYISIGSHNAKPIGIPGEYAKGVIPAVEMLRGIGDDAMPDFNGKVVVVIGGGNVAMDVARTAKRLGAESVTCVYRRRVDDMTALAEEIEEAMAEGCQILPLQAPARIEKDAEGKVAALWTVPQIIGPYGKDGRPKPIPADVPEFRIACDYVIVAIGQAIDARPFEAIGIKTFKGMIQAEDTSSVADVDNVFAGGDAVSGPATVIRAVAAGKVAAANIDAYLGFEHKIKTDVVVPPAHLTNAPPCGRVNLKSHCTPDCKGNFDLVVEGMSRKEADQESERCLRCDYFGFGSFRGGRTGEW